jgi:lipopolysaccharide transport system permease protein
MTRSVTMFIDNANAMKKIVFPKISLPIIIYLVALINNGIFFLAVAAVYVALGHGFSSAILWLPAVVLLTSLFAASIGLVLGVLNVFIRDIGQLVPILLQLGFWFTPIVYFPTIVPELYRDVLKLNPLYWVVDCYHRVLAFQQPPDMQVMLGLSALTLAIAALGLFLFRRASAEMVDVFQYVLPACPDRYQPRQGLPALSPRGGPRPRLVRLEERPV